LLFLRELHNGNSFDNSGARKARLEILYPGFDPNLSLPKPDSKDPTAEHKQAKEKLVEIEVLRPYCPPEYVQKVVKCLIEECNRSGNYRILDEVLENHRNNVSRGSTYDDEVKM